MQIVESQDHPQASMSGFILTRTQMGKPGDEASRKPLCTVKYSWKYCAVPLGLNFIVAYNTLRTNFLVAYQNM